MLNFMPSQLSNQLQVLHSQHIMNFSDLFNTLPKEIATLFSNCLASTLDIVRTTLPPALTSPPPENLALSPHFLELLTKFTSVLTIVLGTVLTTVKFFVGRYFIGGVISKLLTVLNTGLYGNASFDLPALLDSLNSTFINPPMDQPYSALTNLPYELFSMLNNTPHSALRRMPAEVHNHLFHLFTDMVYDFSVTLQELNDLLPQSLNDTLSTPDYHLEGLTVPYVYQAREDTDTDPDKCSICLVEMKDGDKARRLCCLHNFHLECIDHCLKTKRSCPLCRTPIDATFD